MVRKSIRRMRKLLQLIAELIKYEFFHVIAFFLSKCCATYKDLWLISERGVEARDNGYHFFRYLRETHPEVNAYYVVGKNSADLQQVQALGNVVFYKSAQHYLMLAAAKMKISTHIMGFTPDIAQYSLLDQYFRVVKRPTVFLQHGIIQNDMPWYHYPNVRTDLFVCSAPREAAFVRETFGNPETTRIECLGLCRYDQLLRPHETKRQILLMPTWREYAVRNKSKSEFLETAYYRTYQSLLTSPQLHALLDQYDYDLCFYPHFEIQRFIDTFHCDHPRVTIASMATCEVQPLLMESAVLITDFSSVSFDFAYMRKPCVYYQFDREEFFSKHYAEGYFDYAADGFGPVADTQAELISPLGRILSRSAAVEPKYLDRIEAFFLYTDQDNCKRNLGAVYKLQQEYYNK